jgi:hypothetical protein
MLTVCEDSHGRRLEHFCPGGHPNIGRSPLCVAYDQNLGCTTCILEDSHGPGEGLPRCIWKEGLPRAIWKDSHGVYGRKDSHGLWGRTPTGYMEGLPWAIWKDSHGLYGRTFHEYRGFRQTPGSQKTPVPKRDSKISKVSVSSMS